MILPRSPLSMAPSPEHGNIPSSLSSAWHTLSLWYHDIQSLHAASLRKRDALEDRKVMIGVIVGVVLLLFLSGLFYFLWRYHASIRFSRRKAPRRYGHRYGSSKGSQTSSEGMPPPPPV